MTHRPPNDPEPIPALPFECEDVMAQEARRTLDTQRRESGDLPDQPADLPVIDSIPFRNLRSA